jgi:hypothetical protein
MFEGFELVDEEHDYILVDKEQANIVRPALVNSSEKIHLHKDYEMLLHQNKLIGCQLSRMVYSLEKAGVTGNNRDLWLAAANCVIKCMADVIIEGEKLIKNNDTQNK